MTINSKDLVYVLNGIEIMDNVCARCASKNYYKNKKYFQNIYNIYALNHVVPRKDDTIIF